MLAEIAGGNFVKKFIWIVAVIAICIFGGCDLLTQSENGNHKPIANAGEGQIVNFGNTVQLDGSGSRDKDGNTLAYLWSFISTPEGSTAMLSDGEIVNPTFDYDKPGSYTIQLVVINERKGISEPDSVTLVVRQTIKCSIAVEETRWSKGDPVLVSVIVENVSGSKVNLKTISSFTLNEMQYVCPVDIERGGQALPPNARSTISLEKDALMNLRIDISKLKWGMSVSSIWPEHSFYSLVPPGQYKLRMDIEVVDSGVPKWIRSNEIAVDISE
jgi:hypothetical protein